MNTVDNAELPLTAIPCVELVLTEAQIKRFSDIIHLQRLNSRRADLYGAGVQL